MKNDKTIWNSIGLLAGAVIAILALARGRLQTGLLLAAFALWAVWVAALLLSPHIRRHRRSRTRSQQTKKRQDEGISPPGLFQLTGTDSAHTEQLLLRHVNHRISAYLRSAYPDMTWEWCEETPEKVILQGGTGRIRVFGVPDFDHADIKIDRQANISCDMIRIVPLAAAGAQTPTADNVPPNKQPVDPQIWYEVQGRKVLESLVADLNSRGHCRMILHEDGDVCVTEDTAEAAKGHLANFPEKVYWERLVQVFERNGLAAEVTPAGIQVSW